MLLLTVHLTIQPGQVDAFMPRALENATKSRAEPGCRPFDVLIDSQDPTRVMLYEIYDSEAAFEVHQQSAHFKRYVAEAVPLLIERERHFWKFA